MKVVSIIIIRVIPPLTTHRYPLNFLKCLKGVIQQHKIIPVKSHEGHTFYGYKTHVSSATRRFVMAWHGMVWSPHYRNISAPLLIIYHSFRPLALRINDVGMASGVPYFVASGNRAAYPTGARRREIPRAHILAPAASTSTTPAASGALHP